MNEKLLKSNSGFRPDIPDPRDFRLPRLTGSFDWVKGFDVEQEIGKLPYVNQMQTSACVACATTYYQVALHRKTGILQNDSDIYYSIRDLYSRIYVYGGGAYIRDAMKAVTDAGQATEAVVVTAPWTEAHLETKQAAAVEESHNLDASYYTVVGQDIDAFAMAMQQGFGCVSGVMYPTNGHCMYFKKAYLKNGVKTVRTHNSYGPGTDLEFTAADFKSNNFSIINPWVLIPQTSMPNVVDQTRLNKLYLLSFGRLPDASAVTGGPNNTGYLGQDEDFVIDQLNASKELQAKHALAKTADNYFAVK